LMPLDQKSGEALHADDRFRMSDDVLETYVRQLLKSHHDGEVTVASQGGEPTFTGLDFFRRAVELAERLRRPGQCLLHTIQTNGTLRTASGVKCVSLATASARRTGSR